MISDEKRREVVRKLRVLACTPDEIGITEHAVIRDLGISSGIYDDCCKSEEVLAVADLIDRPTCQMVECAIDNGSRSWGMRCTACGDEFEHMKPGFGWRFCPNCGAEVIKEGGCDVREL